MDPTPPYILVTGGAGYIGSHTAKALSRAGFTPVVFDNLSHGYRQAVQFGPFIEAGLEDRAALRAAFRQFPIAGVIHFAGFISVGESVHQPEMYFRSNVANSLNLVEVMREAQVSRIVFSSTAAVYGVPRRDPLDEDHPKDPVNPYGDTKLMVERMLDWSARAWGLKYVALRYFNASGADPEGQLGELHVPETHLIPRILSAALGELEVVDVFGTDYPTHDGTAIRDYIHVCDLAAAHLDALRYLEAGGASGAFNVGTGKGSSVHQVIAAVERVTGHAVPQRLGPRREGDPPMLVADSSKAMRVLCWQPVQSYLDQIMKTAYEWHRGPRWRQ